MSHAIAQPSDDNRVSLFPFCVGTAPRNNICHQFYLLIVLYVEYDYSLALHYTLMLLLHIYETIKSKLSHPFTDSLHLLIFNELIYKLVK